MEFAIVKVDKNNYVLFDEMVFFRKHGRERDENEKASIQIANKIYDTLEDKNLYVLAAQTEQKFIGWISAVYIPKISWTNGRGHLFIDELWVNPVYRRNGIAHALMRHIDVIAQELDAIGLRLYVNANNDEAHALYKKCGYSNTGEAFFMEKGNGA
ncbi:MAG: GNAT family N-acetyltransferase [Treponema sp.]|jgi:ribosomal protein S18 acetylase RimI-like enzyme|nr:GNAT family N-acetyltransferase [Treponema sp.]